MSEGLGSGRAELHQFCHPPAPLLPSAPPLYLPPCVCSTLHQLVVQVTTELGSIDAHRCKGSASWCSVSTGAGPVLGPTTTLYGMFAPSTTRVAPLQQAQDYALKLLVKHSLTLFHDREANRQACFTFFGFSIPYLIVI